MARNKPQSEAAELENDNLLEREQQALERVRQAKAGDRGDSQWRVFVMRLSGPDKRKDGTESRIMECGLEDLDGLGEELRREFGDGLYRVRVRRDGRNVDQWDIDIELSPAERIAFKTRARALETGMLPVPAAQAPATVPANDRIAEAIAGAMKYQADTMRDLITALRPAAPATDPMETFAKTMAAFKGFQDSLPRSEAATGLSMFEKGFALAEKLTERINDAAGDKDGPSILSLVKEFLGNPEVVGALKEFASRRAEAPRGPVQRRIGQGPPAPRPAPRPGPVPPGAPAREHQAEQPAEIAAPGPEDERALQYLIAQAAAGIQPELVVDTALELIPQERLNVLDTLPEDQALELLIQFYPAAAQYRDWFRALIAAMYEPEASPDARPIATGPDLAFAAPRVDGGDTGNPEANARPGADGQG